MPKVFTVDEVRRYVGQFSKECAVELLRQRKFGARMTRVDFKEHKNCIRRKFEQLVLQKIGGV